VAEVPVAIDVCRGGAELAIEVRVRLPVSPPADVRYDLEYRNHLTDAWAAVSTRAGGGPWEGSQPGAVVGDGPNHSVFVYEESETEESYWRLKISRVAVTGASVISN
jgi:hypothetical protein